MISWDTLSSALRPTLNLENQIPVFMALGDRVSLTPMATVLVF
jgi:hypothetical protein